jgi:TorA maturation chaperone TorD
MRDAGLERAISAAGGVTSLSRLIGVSQPAVSGWKRVPPDRVLAIEAATGIPRTALRPDLYAEQELAVPEALDEVDAARADLYALLATLLWHAPDAALLRRLAVPPAGSGPIGEALRALATEAAASDAATAEREHFTLFTGLGGGELLPYASYYLTGFVHERPLAEVRTDLHRLGLVRTEGLSEPEDHIAFLCEVMAALIRGVCGTEAITAESFFTRHLQPWAGRCFTDIESAAASRLYRPIGRLGRVLMDIETQAFALPT